MQILIYLVIKIGLFEVIKLFYLLKQCSFDPIEKTSRANWSRNWKHEKNGGEYYKTKKMRKKKCVNVETITVS